MASYDINEDGATGIKRLGFGLMRLPKAGEAIELTPNVTLRLDPANRAVFYYGCVDRPTK